jgi:hypothetical protein
MIDILFLKRKHLKFLEISFVLKHFFLLIVYEFQRVFQARFLA